MALISLDDDLGDGPGCLFGLVLVTQRAAVVLCGFWIAWVDQRSLPTSGDSVQVG